jgi:putative methyltransferase (TIGR04325 family)
MSAAALARDWLPPALFRAVGRASGRAVRYDRSPGGWAGAMASSRGYSDSAILARVQQATREVVAGRAAFERDSVLFTQREAPFQLLTPLLRHALLNGATLEVIDFGGSLGSSYRQCRPFLPHGLRVRWHVVEQALFVKAGQAEFATDELRFHASLEALPAFDAPPVLLASSVLQYIEHPHEVLALFARSRAQSLVIDRTPMSSQAGDVVCLQQVPRHIYDASYPCWVFGREGLLRQLQPHWEPLVEFCCPEGRHAARGGPDFEFKGLILERRTS